MKRTTAFMVVDCGARVVDCGADDLFTGAMEKFVRLVVVSMRVMKKRRAPQSTTRDEASGSAGWTSGTPEPATRSCMRATGSSSVMSRSSRWRTRTRAVSYGTCSRRSRSSPGRSPSSAAISRSRPSRSSVYVRARGAFRPTVSAWNALGQTSFTVHPSQFGFRAKQTRRP